jgi:large subunit ribosomal protein L24
MANKFKKSDKVKVITGKDKGKISEIISFIPKTNKVIVGGVNVVKKHTKPNKFNPEGGIVQKEMPIHVSNVMHVDLKTNSASKIGFKFLEDGKKVRYLKKTGELIDNKKV